MIPPWMPQPQAPPATDGYVDGVKVIDQAPDSDGGVLVTFARAGGSQMYVRMPYSAWVTGEALAVGIALAAVAAGPPLSPAQAPPAAQQGYEAGEDAGRRP